MHYKVTPGLLLTVKTASGNNGTRDLISFAFQTLSREPNLRTATHSHTGERERYGVCVVLPLHAITSPPSPLPAPPPPLRHQTNNNTGGGSTRNNYLLYKPYSKINVLQNKSALAGL